MWVRTLAYLSCGEITNLIHSWVQDLIKGLNWDHLHIEIHSNGTRPGCTGQWLDESVTELTYLACEYNLKQFRLFSLNII
jgi:hypothetical protein